MILLLLACAPVIEEVTMYGTTYEDPKAEGSALGNVTLTSLFDNASTEVGSTTSADDGEFTLTMPAGEAFFVLVEKAGYATTAFSGVAGVEDFYSGPGLPWIVSDAWVEEVRAAWSGCPGGSEGNFLIGEARLPVGFIEDPQALPLAPQAAVEFTQANAEIAAGCYLDEEGEVDPEAVYTSTLGAWAIFGVVAGPGLLDVAIPAETGTTSEVYKILVPEDGLAGLYPVLVPES